MSRVTTRFDYIEARCSCNLTVVDCMESIFFTDLHSM